jgi:hypothetical protein
VPDQQFQIRITTSADTSGAEQEKAALREVEAQAQKTNAATSGGGTSSREPFRTLPLPTSFAATGQQQVAIESQLQVIAATHNDLLAAQITGNTALVGQLRLELAVRQASLTAMRAQTLTEAELVALTANEEVLLNGIAAAHGRSAIASGINRTQVAALSQSLLTGNISAQSLSRSLSGLAGPLAIAGIAGYTLYNWISHAADESLRAAQNIDKQTGALIKQVQQWSAIAKAAGSPADVRGLGESISSGLEEASAKLKELRDRELNGWEKIKDAISGALVAGTRSGARPIQDAIKAEIADLEKLNEIQLAAANRAIDSAKAAADAWQRVQAGIKTGDLASGIREYTAKLKEAREEEEKLNAVRRQSPADFEQYLVAAKNVELLTGRLKTLTDEESRRSKLRNETLKDLQAELAIDRARASGHEEIAKKLERQRDLEKEIADLIAKGLTKEEARTLAIQKQNLELQIQANKEAAAKRPEPTLTRHLDLSGRDITQAPENIAAHQPGAGLGATEPFPSARPPSGLPSRFPGAEAAPSEAPKAIEEAGAQIAAENKQVTAAVNEMREKVVSGIAQTQAAIVTTMNAFISALSDLKARLSAVETR